MNAITPLQKVKLLVILKQLSWSRAELNIDTSDGRAIDDLYERMAELHDNLQDARNEVRGGQYLTQIEPPSSRYFEPTSVASKMPDGSWVGWTYWCGGGKHSEPEAAPWMEDAYNLTCTEKEVTVTQREFALV